MTSIDYKYIYIINTKYTMKSFLEQSHGSRYDIMKALKMKYWDENKRALVRIHNFIHKHLIWS